MKLLIPCMLHGFNNRCADIITVAQVYLFISLISYRAGYSIATAMANVERLLRAYLSPSRAARLYDYPGGTKTEFPAALRIRFKGTTRPPSLHPSVSSPIGRYNILKWINGNFDQIAKLLEDDVGEVESATQQQEEEIIVEADQLSEAEDRAGKSPRNKSPAFYRARLLSAFAEPSFLGSLKSTQNFAKVWEDMILAAEWTGPGKAQKARSNL